MFNSTFSFRNRNILAPCALALAIASPATHALTVRAGLDADNPGSACQFRTPQEAIDSLPDTDETHVVELEAAFFEGGDASIDVDGRNVHVVTRYESGGCSIPTTELATLSTTGSVLEGGRTVVVRNGGNLTLESVAVIRNRKGGMLVRDSELVLRTSAVSANSTSNGASGAGLVLEGGSVMIEDTEFSLNIADANGGAVFCTRSDDLTAIVRVTGESLIRANNASLGGAIYLFQGCTVVLEDESNFVANESELHGGAIATEAGTGGELEHNLIVLAGHPNFSENTAGGAGGAIQLTTGNDLESRPDSRPLFLGNRSASDGGALNVFGADARARIGAARFILNSAGEHGGAIAVTVGTAGLDADCAKNGTVAEDYCAHFSLNSVERDGSLTGSGGALYVGGGDGLLSINRYAFRGNRGPATTTGDSGGVIAAVQSGRLDLSNSLIFDHQEDLGDTSHLFQFKGGEGLFSFNTMVGTAAGSVILVQPGAQATLIGNIIADNHAGVVGDGDIRGTCNNAQRGTEPAPLDPGFITTTGGRFRLGADSPMIDRALTCDDDDLPPNFRAPTHDLDGRQRIKPGEPEMAVDLGAFEFHLEPVRIFADGFDPRSSR